MKHLDLEQQLRWCDNYKITPNELTLFEILLLLQEDDDPELVKFYFELTEQSRGQLRELLLRLQDVIHLYYYEGYSQEEIGKILGITRTAVQTRMQRARNMLEKELKIP